MTILSYSFRIRNFASHARIYVYLYQGVKAHFIIMSYGRSTTLVVA